ncbi:MAG TPA: autotransporter-associated beta strand repeat-containing protein, partial [Chthoniobacter sp.]|nr:autotransporter-associated beta strand repeat-containing protein [Chthoniobacter sp.]
TANTADYSGRFAPDASQNYRIDTNNQNVTFAADLNAPGITLSKLGAGILTLAGSNRFDNGINLTAGSVGLGSANALGNAGQIIGTGGYLQFTAANTADYSARYINIANQRYNFDTNGQDVTLATPLTSSTGSLSKIGAGTLRVNASNTYTGATTVTGGTLQLGLGNALPSASLVTVGSGATLDTSGLTAVVGALSGGGSVTIGSGTLNAGISNKSSGFFGLITDGGSGGKLIKSGSGTFSLLTPNSYTGGTRINLGILSVSDPDAMGTTGTISFGGGTLQYGGSNTTDYSSRFDPASGQSYRIDTNTQDITLASDLSSPGGTLTKIGLGALVLTGTNAFNSITLFAGTLSMGSTSALGFAGTIIFSGGNLQFTAANTIDCSFRFYPGANQNYRLDTNGQDVTLANNLTSSGGKLTKLGEGTLTLAGTNTYNTGTTLAAGVLSLGSPRAIGTVGTLTFTGGILQFTAFNTTDYSARFDPATNQPYAIDTNGQNVTFATSLTSPGGSLTKVGTGTLTLNAVNTYTGATNVVAGTLVLGVNNAISAVSALTINPGATLGLGGSSYSIGSLAGDGDLDLGDSAFATGGDNTSTVFNGTLSGSSGGVLTKVGTGTLTLTGTNTYIGGTNLNGGFLQLGSAAAIGTTGTISFGGGGLQFSAANTSDYSPRFSTAANQAYCFDTNGQDVTIPGMLSSSGGSLTKYGSGTLTLTATNTYDAGTTFAGGLLSLGGVGTIGTTGTLTFSGGTLQLTASDSSDYSARFSTAANQAYSLDTNGQNVGFVSVLASAGGTLTKLGAGTLTLNAANTYTGATIVSGGTLLPAVSNAIPTGSDVTVNAGATLSLTGSTVIGSLAGDGSVTIGNSTLTTGGNNSSTLFSGTISDSGSGILVKSGNGTFTLSGTNTYAGGTRLTGGVLSLGSTDAIGSSGLIFFNGGNLQFTAANTTDYSGRFSTAASQAFNIDTNGQDVTFSANINSPSGTFTKSGLGKLTLNGTNSFSGGATLNGGILCLGSSGALGSALPILFHGGALQFSPANTADISNRISSATGQSFLFDTNGQNVTFALGSLAGAGNTLTKNGAGMLILNRTNTYSGATMVNDGTLRVKTATAIPSTSAVTLNPGATLLIDNVSAAIGSLSGLSSNLILTGGTLDTGRNGTSTTFAGTVSGTGNLIKSGAGTFTLQGDHTYSGTINLISGTLQILGSLSGSGNINVGNGTNPTKLTGNAVITLAVGCSLTVTNASTLAPNVGLPAGLTLNASSALLFQSSANLALAMANNQAPLNGSPQPGDYSQLTINAGATITLGGRIATTSAGPMNVGDVFPVIVNWSTPITGAFSNTPTAAPNSTGTTYLLTSGGHSWYVNYAWPNDQPSSGVTPDAFAQTTGGNHVALLLIS